MFVRDHCAERRTVRVRSLRHSGREQDAGCDSRSDQRADPRRPTFGPDRKWIFGSGSSRIYYYKYFDPIDGVMVEVNVYELEAAHLPADSGTSSPNEPAGNRL